MRLEQIELHRNAGTQFDPRLVDAFLASIGERDPAATEAGQAPA